MDIGEFIKDYIWVILAVLFYLFAGRKKNKGKQEKPVAKTTDSGSETTAQAARPGLQERLEQALRDMQERAEQELSSQSTVPSTPQKQVKVSAPDITAAEETTVEAKSERLPFEYTSAVPLHQQKTALETISLEGTTEKATSERFHAFREEHGLHYHAHEDEETIVVEKRSREFREGHGLHYREPLSSPVKGVVAPIPEKQPFPLFRDENDIRRAIIAAEILGPPKSARR